MRVQGDKKGRGEKLKTDPNRGDLPWREAIATKHTHSRGIPVVQSVMQQPSL